MMYENIGLEEHLKNIEKVKAVALKDMTNFLKKERAVNNSCICSFLGVKLRYRDDEDCLYADSLYDGCSPFTMLNPYLWEYLKEESNNIFNDQDLFDEPVKNKFYWEITKFIRCGDRYYEQYSVTFSLEMHLLSAIGYANEFNRKSFIESGYVKQFTDEQNFILSNSSQLREPINVILPYKPGDILYVDANPYGKPFYMVYCAETISDKEHFEWTKKEYGFYKREHPCLYISEDKKGLDLTNLCGWFTDYIPFPYAPLDRIQVVDTCDNPLLLNASKLLKEKPLEFWKWYEVNEWHL